MDKELISRLSQGGYMSMKDRVDITHSLRDELIHATGLPLTYMDLYSVNEANSRDSKLHAFSCIDAVATKMYKIIAKYNLHDEKLDKLTLDEFKNICKKQFPKGIEPTQDMLDTFKKIAKESGLTEINNFRYLKKESVKIFGPPPLMRMNCSMAIMRNIATTSQEAELLGLNKLSKKYELNSEQYTANVVEQGIMSAYFTLGAGLLYNAVASGITDAIQARQLENSQQLSHSEFVNRINELTAIENNKFFDKITEPIEMPKAYEVSSRESIISDELFARMYQHIPSVVLSKGHTMEMEFARDFNNALKEGIGLPIGNIVERNNNTWITNSKLHKHNNLKNANIIVEEYAKHFLEFVLKNNLTKDKLEKMTLSEYQELCGKLFHNDTVPTQEMFDNFKKFAEKTGLTEPETLKALSRHCDVTLPYGSLEFNIQNLCKIKIMQEIANTPEKESKMHIQSKLEQNYADIEKSAKIQWTKYINPAYISANLVFAFVTIPSDIAIAIRKGNSLSEIQSIGINQAISAVIKHAKTIDTGYEEQNQALISNEAKQKAKILEDVVKEKGFSILEQQNTKDMIETKYENEQKLFAAIANGEIDTDSLVDVANLKVYSPASELFDNIEKETDNEEKSEYISKSRGQEPIH